jgi:RNA polymerase sigma-70 factor, ECF subfamily
MTNELMVRARAGDVNAYGEVYRMYRAPLFHRIRPRVHDRDTAEDIVQETFLRAFQAKNWAPHPDGSSPLAWLYVIAFRLVVNRSRAKEHQVRFEHSEGIDLMLDREEDPHYPRPEEQAERAAMRRALVAALDLLTPEQRETIEMRYLEGLDIDQVAARTGRTTHAVKSITYRGRQTMIRALSQQWPQGV